MLTTFYPPHNFGGDGIAIQRLAHALVRRGHAVTVVHDVDAYDALRVGPLPVGEATDDGVNVVRLRSSVGAVSPMLTHQLGRPVVHRARLAGLFEREQFDVVMFHNISLIGGPGILNAGGSIRLYEAHEHWLVCASHVLWRHNREACTGRECLRCVMHYHRPPQLWRYTGYLEQQLQHVDAFVAKSEFSREKHREFGFRHPMRVIPYFLPGEPESGRAYGAGAAASPHHRPYFLFVGRLERIKGLDDVIPAFRRYTEADLLIAGDGMHGDALRALAAGAPNVRFLGRVTPAELRRYYEHALALVVPSVGFETFGIIVIEALREGTPVVVRGMGPLPELVESSGGGLVFDTADGLLESLRMLQHDEALRGRLGALGRQAFLRLWTEDAVVPRYLDLVREVAERKGMTRIVDQIVESAV
jgi:glycosyltransferase involved in cell wall biosynthesis